MYAIVDCDNCYVSCERVFRPDLKDKPVVVLSNNDGCVVARSNEAKMMGIKAGTPFFQIQQMFPVNEISVFSSNYELYGELTARVMDIIRQEAPDYFRYSIDECFVSLNTLSGIDYKKWGENLHKRILKSVGMPVSIGVAANKTLAKIASHFAKKYKGYYHCCVIDNDKKRRKALKLFNIEDVWGIGRRYAAKMKSMNITTAYDFARLPQEWVIATFRNVVILRTWKELNGHDAVPNEEITIKKSICTSRSFAHMTNNLENLKTQVANFAVKCAEKLRIQKSAASIVAVFLTTNPFLDAQSQYSNFMERNLITPSNSDTIIVKTANDILTNMFKPGYYYKKAGVIVMGIQPQLPLQQDLFDLNSIKLQQLMKLDKVIDKINKSNGSETVVLAAQQYSSKNGNGKAEVFANIIKHDYRSKNPTTRWSDIIKLK